MCFKKLFIGVLNEQHYISKIHVLELKIKTYLCFLLLDTPYNIYIYGIYYKKR